MGKVKDIPDELVVHIEPIIELLCGKYCIGKLLAYLGLEALYGRLQLGLLEIVPHHQKVYSRLVISYKDT